MKSIKGYRHWRSILGTQTSGEKKIAPGAGVGGGRRPISQAPPLLGRRAGMWGGSARGGGGAYLPCRAGGGGASTPASTPQNDPRVTLINLTTHLCGGNCWWNRPFQAKILCSGAFGAHIRSYTKQRARHGSPFLQHHPPLLWRASVPAPPPPSDQFSRHLSFSSGPPPHRDWTGGGGGGRRTDAHRSAPPPP